MAIDHIGIATTDLESLQQQYQSLFGVDVVHREELRQLRVVFLDFGNGYFELLEPLDEGGPVARFLERSGAGVHHVAVRTADITAALQRASDLDITLVDEEPRPGAWGHDVAFLHPRDTGGVLVEFVQHPGDQ